MLNQFPDYLDNEDMKQAKLGLVAQFISRLTDQIHPLALGGIHRVQRQGRRLAKELLRIHQMEDDAIDKVVDELTSKFFSHHHMINRREAQELLGEKKVEIASPELSNALDDLLRQYELDFKLRTPFVANRFLGSDNFKQARFISGIVESQNWSYVRETVVDIRRIPHIPNNISLQLNPTGSLSPIAGLPVTYDCQLISQGYIRNEDPKGVTV